jgi:hypothetical protein
VEHELNAMRGTQAAVAGVEGIVPTSPAFPVHPNAAGMTQVAGLLRAASN